MRYQAIMIEMRKVQHRVKQVRHMRLMVLGSMLLLPMAGEKVVLTLDSIEYLLFCVVSKCILNCLFTIGVQDLGGEVPELLAGFCTLEAQP